MAAAPWWNLFDIFFKTLQDHFVYVVGSNAQKWPEIAISSWHSPFKAQGIIDQYLGIGEPLRVWNPDPDLLWTKKSWNSYPALGKNLNFITLFMTKDKMQAVLHVVKTVIGNCIREEKSLHHIPMVAKRHLKSRFALFPNFIDLIFNFIYLSNVGEIFWVKSERTVCKFRKRKAKFLCCAHLLHKVGAWNFHVAVTQQWLRIVQNAWCTCKDVCLPI